MRSSISPQSLPTSTLADSLHPHGAHQVVHGARRGAVNVGLLDDRRQRLPSQAGGFDRHLGASQRFEAVPVQALVAQRARERHHEGVVGRLTLTGEVDPHAAVARPQVDRLAGDLALSSANRHFGAPR